MLIRCFVHISIKYFKLVHTLFEDENELLFKYLKQNTQSKMHINKSALMGAATTLDGYNRTVFNFGCICAMPFYFEMML